MTTLPEIPPWLVAIIDQTRAQFAESAKAVDPLRLVVDVLDDCSERLSSVLRSQDPYDPQAVAVAAVMTLILVAEALDSLTEGNPR